MISKHKIDPFSEILQVERILGSVKGSAKQPTVIAIAGMHGNEKAGILALRTLFDIINDKNLNFLGNFYGISGNINAISKNIRFQNTDLNRMWTKENIQKLHSTKKVSGELNEQLELYKTISNILKIEKGPFYFLDLHTTSAKTIPFLTISDSLNNRKFSSSFSIPTILGIEEFLDGPLLSYINEYGHIALGFEAGQHTDNESIKNCISFLWLALLYSNCITLAELQKHNLYAPALQTLKKAQEFYEINYKYTINNPFEQFKMIKGFQNFQRIKKNELLAFSNGKKHYSNFNGKIFMPLYQEKGDDGYFIISKISKFWILFSRFLRILQMHHFLKILPGVTSLNQDPYTLKINPKTAKFLATEVFHLFGYRKKILKKNNWYFVRRDRKSKPLP